MVVTALCPRLTSGARRQLVNLMTLLLLNFPSLLRPGNHSGVVRYNLITAGLGPLPRFRVSLGGCLTGYGSSAAEEAGSRRLRSHSDLVDQLAGRLGPDRALGWVHPHPRVSRLVCLWVGKRRWSGSKAGYKTRIAARSRQKAAHTRQATKEKWMHANPTAAHGLEKVQWTSIR
ncbi:hypothetical protein PR003_g20020 [Phytophthora rubi]|uniref:Uncharacterized protein n=1 Tax=Phytophthora rubi TaxID=129364 RepID=A0A6A3KZN3_9STRA|nr:hypothetical protein PR002_g20174 [Phytophthora rubi]KAE9012792.1 hypothetical protein PR001_g15571 [Phytophthora rubi]KAE9311420.1 hypothetical protein PR003_g20020 [Phytophthora rubi]